MSIVAVIKEALRIAKNHRSLWLFGFLVGLGAGGGSSGSGGAPQPPGGPGPDPGLVIPLVLIGLAVVIGFVILKFVGTGALIEGVRRVRAGEAFRFREGFREGWAHWGVLFRIALLYLGANLASGVVLAGVAYLAGSLFGGAGLTVAVVLALAVGVPWLVTLYIWQAFAERIAVLENRRALDAVRKARLFLHRRLPQGLKLLVASFLGVLLIGAVGFVVLGPVIALAALSARLWGGLAVVAAALVLLPLAFVVVAFIGIMTSSVWTIGYLKEVEA